MEDAAGWYDNTDVISNEDRLRIGRTNALNLLNLELD
jgi:hypothetical protein